MDSLDALTTVLGWCCVLNMGFLLFAGLIVALGRGAIARVHGPIYGLDERDLSRAYFQYLAQYKIAIFVFNLAPYVALKLAA